MRELGPATTANAFSRYWLAFCDGFRVDSPEGRIGHVHEVLFDDDGNEPRELVIRVGILGRRLVAVPIDDVDSIFPREERLVLHTVSARLRHHPLPELRALVTRRRRAAPRATANGSASDAGGA